jgi:hypothetical protein
MLSSSSRAISSKATNHLGLSVPYHLIILDLFCTPRHCPVKQAVAVSDRFKKSAYVHGR